MLEESLIKSDDNIDYLKHWRKTLAYRFLKIKEPSEGWKIQLRRIIYKNKNIY